MTVRVTPVGVTGDVFAVSLRFGWLFRLFGRDDRDFYAVRVPSYLGGHVWIDDKTGKVIGRPSVTRALNAAWRGPRVVPFRVFP